MKRPALLLPLLVGCLCTSPFALAQMPTDSNGSPIIEPGQTPTPTLRAQEHDANQRAQDQLLQERANQRNAIGEQQFQQDRAAAQQRENAVQQNLDQQRLDILNNRDKP